MGPQNHSFVCPFNQSFSEHEACALYPAFLLTGLSYKLTELSSGEHLQSSGISLPSSSLKFILKSCFHATRPLCPGLNCSASENLITSSGSSSSVGCYSHWSSGGTQTFLSPLGHDRNTGRPIHWETLKAFPWYCFGLADSRVCFKTKEIQPSLSSHTKSLWVSAFTHSEGHEVGGEPLCANLSRHRGAYLGGFPSDQQLCLAPLLSL